MSTSDTPSSDFTVDESTLGSSRVIEVTRLDGSMAARVALQGATLIHWRVRISDEDFDLVDGYATEAELTGQDGVRSGLMAPFTNRIEDATFTFDGVQYSFSQTGDSDAPPMVLHGLLRERDFEVRDVRYDVDSVTIVFANQELREGTFVGYPFDVDVEVTFTFSASALAVTITCTNVGVSAAPYSSGWHPYFRLGNSSIDELELMVPASSRVVTDSALIPLPGAGAFEPLRGADDPLDLSVSQLIGSRSIDTCFVDLRPEEDGLIHTRLSDPSRGAVLDVWQQRGNMHVYTADHLTRGSRRSIALEPVEVITNAFNRDDQLLAVALPAGKSRSFRFGVSLAA
jgi:aldose 1-epimerase